MAAQLIPNAWYVVAISFGIQYLISILIGYYNFEEVFSTTPLHYITSVVIFSFTHYIYENQRRVAFFAEQKSEAEKKFT